MNNEPLKITHPSFLLEKQQSLLVRHEREACSIARHNKNWILFSFPVNLCEFSNIKVLSVWINIVSLVCDSPNQRVDDGWNTVYLLRALLGTRLTSAFSFICWSILYRLMQSFQKVFEKVKLHKKEDLLCFIHLYLVKRLLPN